MKIKEKYILFEINNDFALCETEYYLNNYILDDREIMKFRSVHGFKTVRDVLDYAKYYLKIDETDIYNSIREMK